MSIIALAAARNELTAASATARDANIAVMAATEAAREAYSLAIESARATLAAAQDADADAWGAAQDAALAAEQSEIAIVALLMAARHLDRVAARGGHAHPSHASDVPACALTSALAEAGIEAPECEDQIDALRSSLRAAIAELMASDASERAAYSAQLHAERDASEAAL